jgi:Uncharacterised nucleotidyltransferase
MTNSSRALLPLCACFRGVVPPRADWNALLELANHTLTTPSLIEVVRSQRASIPDEVAAYVEAIHQRNMMRNDRLIAQLEEAVLALNRAGITPVLIKGAAMLATCPPSDRALRLMSDLDLVVGPGEVSIAKQRLTAIGYSVDYESDRRHTKWYVDLSRPQDVGMIDLQEAFPAEAVLNQTEGALRFELRSIQLGAASALVPSPELQVLVLLVHDQFQDHDYWTGNIDLRHLLDLKNLFAVPGNIRWDVLMTIASSTLLRNALEAQQLLLTRLLGVTWPAGRPQRLMSKLQVWRQLLQARHPGLRPLLLPMGLIHLRSHRERSNLEMSASDFGSAPQARKRWFPKLESLLFLLSLARRYRAGKL